MSRPFFYRAKILPKYDPVHQFERFETKAASLKTRDYRVWVLENWLEDDSREIKERKRGDRRRLECERQQRRDVKALLEKLCSCRKGEECNSPACPVCRRRYRRWYCSEVLRLANGQDIWFLTFVPTEGPQPIEELDIPFLETILKRLLKRFNRKAPPGMHAVGTLDLTAKLNGTIEPHFHVNVWGCSRKEVQDIKIDKRKRKRPKGGRVKGPHLKRGKGAPWVVGKVMPEEWMDVISYTARQTAKGDEVDSSRNSWRSRRRKDDGSYFDKYIRPQYQRTQVERWLLMDRCSWKDLRVLFRVEKKNGLSLRSTLGRSKKEAKKGSKSARPV